MRTVSSDTTAAWTSALKIGTRRPMVRATIGRLQVGLVPYDMASKADVYSGQKIIYRRQNVSGVWASAQFGWNEVPVELPNIASMSWQRSIEQDVATATITLWNTQILPLGQAPANDYEFDIPGALSFNRGTTADSISLWGQSPNGWRNLIAPDRVIRTYEGYGFDSTSPPDQDAHLYPSGVWIIDTVKYTNAGLIVVTMRDLGRLLLDQICFPPVIPEGAYPLTFSTYAKYKNPVVYTGIGGWFRPRYAYDSNKDLAKAGVVGVSRSGAVNGHSGPHAFDSNRSTYWMSLNNAITHGHGYVEGSFSSRTVGAIKLKLWNGPYSVFVSVYAGGKWQGSALVPHHPGDPLNDRIPHIFHGICKKNTETIFKFRKQYSGVTRIRVSVIHDGTYGGDGQHIGIYDVQISDGVNRRTGGDTYTLGNYGDFTDMVKYFCAWGGFFWTKTVATQFNRENSTDGSQTVITPTTSDPVFPQGRVWGDFEASGTAGIVDFTVDAFDKKPLMDCISQVREIVGYNFFIDEQGGVIWRSPNIWQVGNYLSNVDGGPNLGRTATIPVISDDETMMGLEVSLDSTNVRERTFVASSSGQYGGVAKGIFSAISGPFESGMRRVGGWTDQNFASAKECQIMADLISVRAMFTYRTTNVTIAGNPQIQIDDQVRLRERVTSETYLHYVKSINSEFDMTTGKWIYTLGTHWLGDTPFSKWVFDPNKLSADTRAYLRSIGKI